MTSGTKSVKIILYSDDGKTLVSQFDYQCVPSLSNFKSWIGQKVNIENRVLSYTLGNTEIFLNKDEDLSKHFEECQKIPRRPIKAMVWEQPKTKTFGKKIPKETTESSLSEEVESDSASYNPEAHIDNNVAVANPTVPSNSPVNIAAHDKTHTSDHVPNTSDEVPNTSDEVPNTSDEVPNTSDEVPNASDEVPNASNMVPNTSEMVPNASNMVPSLSKANEDAKESVPSADSGMSVISSFASDYTINNEAIASNFSYSTPSIQTLDSKSFYMVSSEARNSGEQLTKMAENGSKSTDSLEQGLNNPADSKSIGSRMENHEVQERASKQFTEVMEKFQKSMIESMEAIVLASEERIKALLERHSAALVQCIAIALQSRCPEEECPHSVETKEPFIMLGSVSEEHITTTSLSDVSSVIDCANPETEEQQHINAKEGLEVKEDNLEMTQEPITEEEKSDTASYIDGAASFLQTNGNEVNDEIKGEQLETLISSLQGGLNYSDYSFEYLPSINAVTDLKTDQNEMAKSVLDGFKFVST